MDGYQTKIRLDLVASKALISKMIKNWSLFSYLDICAVMFSTVVCFTWSIVSACVCSAELFFHRVLGIVDYQLLLDTDFPCLRPSLFKQTAVTGGGGGVVV